MTTHKRIAQYTQSGVLVETYNSILQASVKAGIVRSGIQRALKKGGRYHAGGFLWRYARDEKADDVITVNTGGQEPVFHETEDKFSWRQNTETGQATFEGVKTGEKITTLERALEFCDADLDMWRVAEWECSHWPTTMKMKTILREDGTEVKPGIEFDRNKVISLHKEKQIINTRIKILFKTKTTYAEDLREMLVSTVSAAPVTQTDVALFAIANKRSCAMEFCVFDHHLGKEGFDSKTLEFNWSLDTARTEMNNVVDWGLSRIDLNDIEEFIVPVGNDLLHTDGNLGMTTKGTKISGEMFWLKLFKYARELTTAQIARLSAIAPVKVYVVPGNHDETSMLALGEVLDAAFAGHDNVEVVNTGAHRLYHAYGVSLIAYNHGNDVSNPAMYAHAMVSDVPEMLGAATKRYVHLGDKHRRIQKEVFVRDVAMEDMGTEIEVCTSLSPTDIWHSKNLFIGPMRRSKIFVYHRDHGQIHNLIYNMK